MKEEYEPLYKILKNGTIKVWEMKIENVCLGESIFPEISTRTGLLGVDPNKYKHTFKIIKHNNRAIAWDNASKKADSMWRSKKKSGWDARVQGLDGNIVDSARSRSVITKE